jgi:molybdopterin-guanine dinucleotide biosynthesis protein A
MGRDKAWLEMDGLPMIVRVIQRLQPIAAEFIISTNDPDPFVHLAQRLPVPLITVSDRFANAGPLAGLHSGLSAMHATWAFAVATDMPFVNPDVVRGMQALSVGYDAVVPRITTPDHRSPEPEPLHALYHARCLQPITDRLVAGERRLISFLPHVNVLYADNSVMRPLDPHYLSFMNVNTPDEWEKARRLLS